MKKVVILVDGQNLFYSLKELDLMERDIDWTLLFKSLLESNDELIRAYWFRPQKILEGYYTAINIRNMLCTKKYKHHWDNFRNNPSLVPAAISEAIEAEAKSIEEWMKSARENFSNIEYNYDELQLKYENVEMVKSGVVKIDPFKKQYVGEKGVDIALAVKMIALSVNNMCDKIILISGDYDYGEAIKFVKDRMTKMHIVKIHKGYPPRNKSLSRELAVLADKIIDVYESDIRSKFVAT